MDVVLEGEPEGEFIIGLLFWWMWESGRFRDGEGNSTLLWDSLFILSKSWRGWNGWKRVDRDKKGLNGGRHCHVIFCAGTWNLSVDIMAHSSEQRSFHRTYAHRNQNFACAFYFCENFSCRREFHAAMMIILESASLSISFLCPRFDSSSVTLL